MTDDELTATDRRWIQVRSLLDRWFLAVVVILLLAVVMGGWLAYPAHVEPGTEAETVTVGSWSEQPSLSHAAEVQNPNPVFSPGQTLAGQSTYFTSIAPTLTGTYAYEYRLEGQVGDASMDVDLESSLVYRSVDGDGNVYWEQSEPLDEQSVSDVGPGETVETSFDVNVTDLAAEIDAIEGSLGASPGTAESVVVVQVTASGQAGDASVANSHTAEFAIEESGGTYTVETSEDGAASQEFSDTVETEMTYGALHAYGSLAMIVLGLMALGWLVMARYQGDLAVTDDEREALVAAAERAEFVDWLSRGRFPIERFDGPRIELDSLEDIVDVAIDSNRRVIEDVGRGAFFVQDGDAYYVYEPEVKPPAFQVEGDEYDGFGELGGMDGELGAMDGMPGEMAMEPEEMAVEPDEEYGDLLDDAELWSDDVDDPSAEPAGSFDPAGDPIEDVDVSDADPDDPFEDPGEPLAHPDESADYLDESVARSDDSVDDSSVPDSEEASPEEALAAVTADDGDDSEDSEATGETDPEDLEIGFDEDEGSSEVDDSSYPDDGEELVDSVTEVDPEAEMEVNGEAGTGVDPEVETEVDPEERTEDDTEVETDVGPEMETEVGLDGQSVVDPDGSGDTMEPRHETGESIFDLGTTRVPDSILTGSDPEDEESSDADADGGDEDSKAEDEIRTDGSTESS